MCSPRHFSSFVHALSEQSQIRSSWLIWKASSVQLIHDNPLSRLACVIGLPFSGLGSQGCLPASKASVQHAGRQLQHNHPKKTNGSVNLQHFPENSFLVHSSSFNAQIQQDSTSGHYIANLAMGDSSGRLPAFAKTTMASAAAGTSIYDILRRFKPNIAFLQTFFSTWLKLDLTTLAAALTIFSTISGAARVLQGVALKVYWYFTKFFTASISIAASDKLNKEILNWIGAQVLTRQGTRILTARTETIQNNPWLPRRATTERNDLLHEKRVPIRYLPTFGTTWFIFERNVFLVKRISPRLGYGMVPDEYAAAPEGKEPLVVMVLGRSVAPIKRFLDMCREFADKQRESFITVHASKNQFHGEPWDTTILRPIRPMETVHFDETTKAELIADIENYLDPTTRRFYTARGIPYRRGYLLHGTPGTGKTSLSLALSGQFGLDLYLLHIPSVREDSELERLFTALPPRCIVLLEDIDAVGMKRQPAMGPKKDEEREGEDGEDEESESEDEDKMVQRSRCTLSGLLNVLDGVTSQEGRIVLMTSNHARKLDKALVRPGRIDRMIFLGAISPRSAELMFLRMYTPDANAPPYSKQLEDGALEKLALEFSSHIPDNTFTPAQLQGFLLNHRSSALVAARETKAWVDDEKKKMDEAKQRAKQIAEWRKKKKRENAMKMFAKNMGADGIDEELAEMAKEVDLENQKKAAEKEMKSHLKETTKDVVNGKGRADVEKATAAKREANADIGRAEELAKGTTNGEVVTEEEVLAATNREMNDEVAG